MKSGIHPQVHKDAKTTCISCGAVYKIPTTVKELQVEVCSACHPIYTGQYRGLMASGRVDRFRKLQEAAGKKKEEKAARAAKPKTVLKRRGKGGK